MVDSRLVERLQACQRILVVSGGRRVDRQRHPGFPWSWWCVDAPSSGVLRGVPRVGVGAGGYGTTELETWEIYQHARPNAVHHAIVALERAGKVVSVVTQNVDGLHRRAATSPSLLVELHGTDLLVECPDIIINRGASER